MRLCYTEKFVKDIQGDSQSLNDYLGKFYQRLVSVNFNLYQLGQRYSALRRKRLQGIPYVREIADGMDKRAIYVRGKHIPEESDLTNTIVFLRYGDREELDRFTKVDIRGLGEIHEYTPDDDSMSIVGVIEEKKRTPTLLEYIGSADLDVKIAAIHLCGEKGLEESLEILSEILADARQPEEARQAACESIGMIGGSVAVEILSKGMKFESRAQIVVGIVWALALTEEPGVADILIKALNGPPEVREAIVEAFAFIEDPRLSEMVSGLLDDHNGNVKLAATKALGYIGNERSVPLLLSKKEEKKPVRNMAVLSLGSLEDSGIDVIEVIKGSNYLMSEAAELLIQALVTDDDDARKTSESLLIRIGIGGAELILEAAENAQEAWEVDIYLGLLKIVLDSTRQFIEGLNNKIARYSEQTVDILLSQNLFIVGETPVADIFSTVISAGFNKPDQIIIPIVSQRTEANWELAEAVLNKAGISSIEYWESLLCADEELTKRAASWLLSKMGSAGYEVLVRCFHNDCWRTRRASGYGLWTATPDSLGHIISLFDGQDDVTANRALKLLVCIGDRILKKIYAAAAMTTTSVRAVECLKRTIQEIEAAKAGLK